MLMTPDHTRPDDAWTIIIPVKDTGVAKTRLSALTQPVRATLALAFALDAASAALACPVVHEVVVVSNDDLAGRELSALGAHVVRDAADDGHNAALTLGVSYARRHEPGVAVAALSGDLPSLRAADLAVAFAAASALPHWFVADAEGVGTTLLASAAGVPLVPSFGPRSRHDHLMSGAVDLAATGLDRLRRDVDTVEHLWQAVRLGVGRHTTRALADLDLDLELRAADIA